MGRRVRGGRPTWLGFGRPKSETDAEGRVTAPRAPPRPRLLMAAGLPSGADRPPAAWFADGRPGQRGGKGRGLLTTRQCCRLLRSRIAKGAGPARQNRNHEFMKTFSLIIAVSLFALGVMGCRTHVPKEQSFAPSHQPKAYAAEHWQQREEAT